MNIQGRVRKYTVNDTYFDTIDTEPKAYWLGFLYADGCVVRIKNRLGQYRPPSRLQLKLAAVDTAHVEAFKASLGFTGPVHLNNRDARLLPNGRLLKPSADAQVAIHSRRVCDDLTRLGCPPAKSLILRFPTSDQVPDHLLRHFIRGYFDGDGCISSTKPKKWKRQHQASMVGTAEFLSGVQHYLVESHGFSRTKIGRKQSNQIHCLTYGGNRQIRRLFEVLYRDATVWLPRKHECFLTCVNASGGYRGLPPCVVIEPSGTEARVTDYRSYAREQGLHPSTLWHVLVGDKKHCKGYRLARFEPDENGIVHPLPPRMKRKLKSGRS